ncbi:MAG: hypothetical protein V4805_14375 [Pseudomonadota bacterium]
MPIFGIGLHLLVALFFAIHALRNGRPMYWLLVLFSFPLLGSVAYFVVEFLPASKVNRGLNKVASTAVNLLDPEKEVREARKALDLAPSAQNQIRLAKALLARGETQESLKLFDLCLAGPFSNDPEVRFGAASAKLQAGQIPQALELAKSVHTKCPDYLLERATLLLANAHAAAGDATAAREQFEAAVSRFGSVDARAQYAIWAAGSGDLTTAEKLHQDLMQSQKHWKSHTKSLNRPVLQQVEAAISAGRRA